MLSCGSPTPPAAFRCTRLRGFLAPTPPSFLLLRPQPEMEGCAVGDIKALRGVAEMVGAVTHHMITEFDVVQLFLRAQREFLDAPANESFSWHDANSVRR